jgi:hypothetical protein
MGKLGRVYDPDPNDRIGKPDVRVTSVYPSVSDMQSRPRERQLRADFVAEVGDDKSVAAGANFLS